MNESKILLLLLCSFLLSCSEEDNPPAECQEFFCEYSSRNFEMGFSSWAYAPTVESVNDTYQFLEENGTIYSEHIDSNIPWNAWINDLPLPTEFTNEMAARAANKIPGTKLTVSVSLLNSLRNELAYDYDGTIPNYTALNDTEIEDAYFKHLQYIANQLNPDYLIIAIEVNELLINAADKWDEYKLLISNVKTRMQQEFPSLPLSESITLHNLYEPDASSNPSAYIDELVTYANAMDLVTISFYPYFKGLNSKEGFQEAFNFLHERINKPIAFAETSHLSEDLSVASFDLFIPGSYPEQNDYMETLMINAQEENYEYVIWWAHRDYNELWETFPDEVKDLGKLWLSTGIINEDGVEKESYTTWQTVLDL